MDPRAAKFVGVKNMMNFRRGYAGVMKAYFVVALPGPTPIDYRALPYQRVQRPIYPLDDLPDPPRMSVTRSRGSTTL
jgi:microcystin degradation protein MlrC